LTGINSNLYSFQKSMRRNTVLRKSPW